MKQVLIIALILFASCKQAVVKDKPITITSDDNYRALKAVAKQTHCINMMATYINNVDSFRRYHDSTYYYDGVIDAIYRNEK
jgi:hypothetical protein